jgi:Protein of unknown function (DUF2474)
MPEADGSRLSRLAWFIGLWAGGVLTVGATAYLLRVVILALG